MSQEHEYHHSDCCCGQEHEHHHEHHHMDMAASTVCTVCGMPLESCTFGLTGKIKEKFIFWTI